MISDHTSEDIPPEIKILNTVIPILMHLAVLSQFCHLTKCDIINEIKVFLTVYRRIYCHKFLTLSNQTLRYKSKCIRISHQSI